MIPLVFSRQTSANILVNPFQFTVHKVKKDYKTVYLSVVYSFRWAYNTRVVLFFEDEAMEWNLHRICELVSFAFCWIHISRTKQTHRQGQ